MSNIDRASDALEHFIRPVFGLPAWGVRQGYGSFLYFNFGQPKLNVTERQRDGRTVRRAHVSGEWRLWTDCCHWRLRQDAAQIAWSEDDRSVIERATSILNGQKLVAVSASAREGRSSFTFDLGGLLETWPYEEDPALEQWTLLTDTGAFTYRGDGAYADGPSTTPYDERRWLPLINGG